MKRRDSFISSAHDVNSEIHQSPKHVYNFDVKQVISEQSISEEYPLLNDTMSKYQALFVSFNILIGFSILILPNSFLQGGALLSLIFLVGVCIFSYLTSEFIIETIGICNFFSSYEAQALRIQSSQNEAEHRQLSVAESKKITKYFEMNKKFELSEVAGVLWGKQSQVLMSLSIVLFLFGATIAKSMSISRILSQIFQEIPILNTFTFWLLLIVTFSATLSFRSVSHFAWVQEYAAFIKITALYAIILGCGYEIYRSGFKGLSFGTDYPLINTDNFQAMFSIGISSFQLHHSIPAFVKPITPQKDVRWVMRISFFLSFMMTIALAFAGIAAFGTDIIKVGEVKFLIENLKNNENIIYYLSSIYVFLIVSSIPTMTITQRNTLMKLVAPDKIPIISSEITVYTFAFTATLLAIMIGVCFLASNIQGVLNFMGVFGVLLLFVIPSLFIISARSQLYKQYKISYKLNKQCTSIQSAALPYIILIMGIAIFVISSYHLTE